MTHVKNIEELTALVGTHLGYGEYRTVTQEQVNQFADATGDHQWIHVDPERAAAGPFGHTIAHGYLTLSLIPVLLGGLLTVDGVTMGINYGANKVRFTSPVPVGSDVRAGATLTRTRSAPVPSWWASEPRRPQYAGDIFAQKWAAAPSTFTYARRRKWVRICKRKINFATPTIARGTQRRIRPKSRAASLSRCATGPDRRVYGLCGRARPP